MLYRVNQRIVLSTSILFEAKSPAQAKKEAARWIGKFLVKTVREADEVEGDEAVVEDLETTGVTREKQG